MPSTRLTNLLLTFDAFGTLFAPRFPIATQYALAAQEHGLGVKEADLEVAFRKDQIGISFTKESKRNPNYGKSNGMKPEEWWVNIITNTFTNVTSAPLPPSLVPHLIRRFSSNIGYKLYPEAIPLLRTLRSPPSNWPYISTTIGVVTNSDSRVTSVLNSLGIGVRSYYPTVSDQNEVREEGLGDKALLDFVTLSYDVGFEKPDIEIFNAARKIGCQRADGSSVGVWRCVHVGDDLGKDYHGAESAGWAGILVDRMAEKSKEKGKFIVRDLAKVLEVLIDFEKEHG